MRISDWSSDVCSSDLDMDDWGFDGPTIGPLDYVHTTYGDNIKLCFTNHADALELGLEQEEMFNLVEGCFPFQDRKSVVSGKSVSVRVDIGCCRLIQQTKQ